MTDPKTEILATRSKVNTNTLESRNQHTGNMDQQAEIGTFAVKSGMAKMLKGVTDALHALSLADSSVQQAE